MTETLIVDPAMPDSLAITRAAERLLSGGLVAFPTETVYGLGALALRSECVRRIFTAKGRPSHNPVIAHVAEIGQARELVRAWPDAAQRLAEAFWPGPLTLVLPRAAHVPPEVTAGAETVAVRIPAHPVALALLRAVRQPVAAPSANRSTGISPTSARHVLKTLQGRIDMVLDGGPCPGGIESTVVSIGPAGNVRILRPGLVTGEELEAILGVKVAGPSPASAGAPLPSPGLLERHYAPDVPLVLAAADGYQEVSQLLRGGQKVGWIAFEGTAPDGLSREVVLRALPMDPEAYASQIYAVLHELETSGVGAIVAARLPEGDRWLALRDRLRRAATPG